MGHDSAEENRAQALRRNLKLRKEQARLRQAETDRGATPLPAKSQNHDTDNSGN
jgi:hypothetical protein